jgi:hypothetical protein
VLGRLIDIGWRPGFLLFPAAGLVVGLVGQALSGPKTGTTPYASAARVAALTSDTTVQPGPDLPGRLPKIAVPRLRQPASALRPPARPAPDVTVPAVATVTPSTTPAGPQLPAAAPAPVVAPVAPVVAPVAPQPAPEPQRGPVFDSSG